MACALFLMLATPVVDAAAADDITALVHAPQIKSAHPPLIVLLHGIGADERDMLGLWHDLPQTFVVVSPRAPFKHPGGGYQWYGAPERRTTDLDLSRKIVDLIVDNAVEQFDADPQAIFLGGFSQGAVMTYEVALHEPGRFRGAAVLSGLLFPSATEGLPKADRSHDAFFIAHGTDDQRVPFSAATSAQATLGRLDVPIAFHTYPGMGHTIGPAETRDLSVWLAERSRR